MKLIFFIVLLVVTASCGVQHSLQKAYVGKPAQVLQAKFGYPTAILPRENDSMLVYEIVKELKSTEIMQAKLTLDPIYSPKVDKTERYYFTIKQGIISNAKLEEIYEK